MKRLFTPKTTFLLIGIIISIQTFAAFINFSSGNNDKKISLKNFNKRSHSTFAYPSFRLSQFQFKGSQDIYHINSFNIMQGRSIIRLEQGNTTYVYPYNYNIKTPLFKTPSPPPLR